MHKLDGVNHERQRRSISSAKRMRAKKEETCVKPLHPSCCVLPPVAGSLSDEGRTSRSGSSCAPPRFPTAPRASRGKGCAPRTAGRRDW